MFAENPTLVFWLYQAQIWWWHDARPLLDCGSRQGFLLRVAHAADLFCDVVGREHSGIAGCRPAAVPAVEAPSPIRIRKTRRWKCNQLAQRIN